MPWALHIEILKRSFGQRAEAVRAKFLKRIKALVDLCDRYHLSVNLDAQGFSLAQAVGFRDRNENHIGLLIRSKICHGQMQCVFRRRRAPFVPADTDGNARLARSSNRLKRNSPIGKWTSIGCSGCRSVLPSRKSFNMACLYSGGRFAPAAAAIFRHFAFDIRATLMP